MRRVLCLLASALLASVALGACGGDDGPGEGGASVAPADAALFLSVDTDFESDQWEQAEELLRRFPGGTDLLRGLLRELDDADFERDVKPAVGDEVAVVWLDLGDDEDSFVFLTQPADEAKFRELVERGDEPGVVGEVEGWSVAAPSQATLDRFEEARGDDSLAESDDFERVTGDLPEDALLTFYVSGAALTREATVNAGMTPEERAIAACFLEDGSVPALGGALAAEGGGVRIALAAAQGAEDAPKGDGSDLAGEIPAGATAFLSIHGLGDILRDRIRCAADASADAASAIAQVELGLGVSLDEDILPLLAGETVVASYPAEAGGLTQAGAAGMPVVLLAMEVEDEGRAREVADRIATRASAFVDGVDVQDVTVGGVEAKRVQVRGAASVFYAAFEGKLFLSSTEGGLAAVAAGGDALADDEAYTSAREAADAPDEATALVFLSLGAALQELGGFGGMLPPEIRANIEPLRSLLVWGGAGDERLDLEAFLEID